AGKIYKTDVVLTGQRRSEEAMAARRTKADAEARKDAVVKQALKEGQAALDAKQFDRAVGVFQAALKQAPGNVDLLVGLGMAERGRDTQSAVEKRQVEEQQRQLAFRKLIDGAKANMAAKQFDAAVSNLTEAQKLSPADREVQALLTEAKQ